MLNLVCDFDGWATKNDILCTDGRVIRHGAFADNDGEKVPLCYQHGHSDPSDVIGSAILEHTDDGVYAYCTFNDTQKGQDCKELVRHGDLDSLSIYANKLKQRGRDVIHGCIKEVSLVLSGANAGAKIMNTYISHADGTESIDNDEAIIQMNCPINFHANNELSHAEEEETEMANSERTVKDVIDSMTEEQKKVMYFMIGQALNGGNDTDDDEAEHSDYDNDYITHSDLEEIIMKKNLFDNGYTATPDELQHAEDFKGEVLEMMSADNRNRNNISSLRDAILEHAESYGIQDIEWLFPDARQLNNIPEFIKRDDTWVDIFMNGTKHLPFSRVKMRFADITADEARAKGYIKGNRKEEEVFTLLKRAIEPQTIYKKQKLDRDDIIDITDFDVVVWLKSEMRMMLNEEIARAGLIGDGRSTASNDKIKETNIIPIWKDADLFTISVRVEVKNNDSDDAKSEKMIRAFLKKRKDYKGSGNITFFTTEDVLTDLLLIEDGIGNRKYKEVSDVAKALRVNRIVTVPVMENQTRVVDMGEGKNETRTLLGIAVDLSDYSFGSDKGGSVNMFDDFDIDFNQYKYLMEVRCSGGLTKPFSAMAVESVTISG